jgi:hypothetical protein
MARMGIRWALAAAGALALTACGDDLKPATGRSMSAPPLPSDATSARPNRAPRVTSLSIEPSHPQPGQVVQASVSVNDPDGDPTSVRFTWRVNDELIASRGPSLELPGIAKDARVEVEAVASDGRAESPAATAHARVGNSAPVISDVHFDRADEVRAGDTVVAVVAADDPDGEPVQLSYQWMVNGRAAEGDSSERFDTSGLHRGDGVAVRVVASDGEDESEGFDTPNLVLGNAAPKITSEPPPGMGADGIYRYAVEATDPDRDRSLRFSLGAAPEGAHVDPVGGEITWQPTFKQTGTHPIEVIVSDGHGGETKQRFEIVVKEVVDGVATPAPAKPAAGEPAEQPPAAPAED